ncbi:hypothetical protein KCU91_g19410, partial [Aureobasidium melanogenum]
MSSRREVMGRKQKVQRRKKINREEAATPQALIGNCRVGRFALLGRPTAQILRRSAGQTSLSLFVPVHILVDPLTSATMAPKAKPARAQENVQLGPQTREGELVFGVARIFASFNDTFVHVTDLS